MEHPSHQFNNPHLKKLAMINIIANIIIVGKAANKAFIAFRLVVHCNNINFGRNSDADNHWDFNYYTFFFFTGCYRYNFLKNNNFAFFFFFFFVKLIIKRFFF